MKRISLLLATLITTFSFCALPLRVAFAADAKTSVCEGVGSLESGNTCTEPTEGNVNSLVAAVVSILSWIAGIAAVVMVILSGIKYSTSGGDANKVGAAKKTLLYALIGLVIAVLTQVIVRLAVHETITP